MRKLTFGRAIIAQVGKGFSRAVSTRRRVAITALFGVGAIVLGGVLAGQLPAVAQTPPPAGNGTLPGMRFLDAEQLSPATAKSQFFTPAGNTATYGWATTKPIEITATAAALENDPQRIFAFVRNNIRYEPRMGAQKGAVGALIDRSGTAFDQAQLLVELLRASGYTASYRVGTVTLTGSQFNDWLGITSPVFARQFLANGGIPASVSGTSSITSVQMNHAWVQVTISGTTYQLDPSYKVMDRWAQIDIATDAGFSPASFISTAANPTGSGTENGVAYITGVNLSGAESQLNSAANSLLTKIRTTYKDKRSEEIMGGERIRRVDDPWNAATTGTLSVTLGTYTGGLPDKFRAKLRAESLGCRVDLFVDEIYGRRLTFNQQKIEEVNDGVNSGPHTYGQSGFSIDDKPMPGSTAGTSSDCIGNPVVTGVRLTVDLPYPQRAAGSSSYGTWMDRVSTKTVDTGHNVAIVHGWGDTGSELQARFSDNFKPSMPWAVEGSGPPGVNLEYGGPPMRGSGYGPDNSKERLYAGWLAQMSRAVGILEGVSNTRIQHHYTIGVVYTHVQRQVSDISPRNGNHDPGEELIIYATQDTAVRIDIDSGYSTTSLTASTVDKTATRHTIAAMGAMLEGSLFEQQQDAVDTSSTAQRFPFGQEIFGSTIRFHRLLPGSGAVQEYRGGVITPLGVTAPCRGQTTANNAYTVIQANDRYLGPGTTQPWHAGDFNGAYPYEQRAPQSDQHMQRGCAFVAFNGDASEIAHLVTSVDRELKGGAGPSGKDLADRAAPMQGDLLKDAFKDRSNLEGVDLRTGAYTYRPAADLVVGQGDFPYSLSFQRVFQAGGSTCPKCTTGWTHNLDIRATTSGGGLEGMGQTAPQALAGPMVAIKAAFELYKNDAQSTANQVSALGVMRWLANKLTNNVVTVNQGASSETFVRVADGTLVAPPGSQSSLVQTGARRKLQQGFFGRSPIWYYDEVSFVRKSGDGDEITFGFRDWNPTEIPYVKNSFGSLSGHAQGFFATAWTFPQGVTLTFDYCDEEGTPYIENNISYSSGRKPCADRLERVSSNLGVWIDVDLLNAASSDGRSTSVTTAYGPEVAFDEYFMPVTHLPIRVNSFTDAAGKVWTYEWEMPPLTGRASAAPRLKRVKEPEKAIAQFELTYDALGRVRTWRDGDSLAQGSGGPAFTYYAPNFGFGARKDPLDGFVRIDYDTDDRAVSQYDEMGRRTRTEYDGRGRVKARVSPFLDRTEFTYDDRNNVTQKKQIPSPTICPPGYVDGWWCQTIILEASYGGTWNKPTRVTLPPTTDDNEERHYDYTYNSQGLVTQVQEPPVFDGVSGNHDVRPTWALTYDSFGRPLTMTEPTGRKVTTTYGGTNPAFCKTSQIVASQSGGLNLTSTFVCDSRGDVTSVTDPRGNVSTTSYDALRRKQETLGPAGTNIRAQWVYDPAGRVLEEKVWDATAALWRTSFAGYSIAGRQLTVTDPSGDTSRTCYDALGRQEKEIDPEGRATLTEFNAASDVLRIWRWLRGDPTSASCELSDDLGDDQAPAKWRTYTYAASGVMTSEADAKDNVTTFSYDGLARKIVTTFPDPDGAGSLVAPNEATLTNERGQLVYTRHRSNAGDVRWSKVFSDPAGRATHLWEYTAAEVLDATTQPTLWPKGRVARTSYDLGGRVVYKDVSQQPVSGTFGPRADDIDETLVRDRRAYAYDPAGRVTQDQVAPDYGANPSFTLQYTYAYDAAGNRTSIQWPDAWTATYTFDAANRMSTVSFTGGSGTSAYDSQSRPTSFTRSNGTTTSYTYETDSDLATLTHAYASGSPTTATFTYMRDKAGLITYRGNPAAYDWEPTLAYARSYGPANPLNQVSSEAGVSLAFDVRGNMTTDGTWTFAYDQRNRLIGASKAGTTATYDYDADDRRTKKTVNGVVTRIVWSGDAELAEADAVGNILRRYVPGAAVDTPQAMVAAGGTVTWLHADGQGSIVNTSTGAGAAGTPITYSPYGELGAALPANMPFGYTGRYLDAETGLWFYRARYYHPRLGQFLQTDPIGTKDDSNLYLYVGADPVNYEDPDGQQRRPPRGTGRAPVSDSAYFANLSAQTQLSQIRTTLPGYQAPASLRAPGSPPFTSVDAAAFRGTNRALDFIGRGNIAPGQYSGGSALSSILAGSRFQPTSGGVLQFFTSRSAFNLPSDFARLAAGGPITTNVNGTQSAHRGLGDGLSVSYTMRPDSRGGQSLEARFTQRIEVSGSRIVVNREVATVKVRYD